ncbi:hypothetical protein [Elizabethkingia ursingii]|uniref:hypothetical protein n=1 Tax=Elizabethkingia ursingii TaxID=1756150 RepID=UPI0013F66EB6|nr:hypothetical protein [Elizabethkingia ursingii]
MTSLTPPLYSKTGSLCPESGIWKNEGPFHTSIAIAKGDIMPHYCGEIVTWKLLWCG